MGRVLVVDDEPDVLLLCRLNLQQRGHELLEAADGSTALALARDRHPDVIVLDLMLPGISGYDVLEALQRDEETTDIPVLVLTAKSLRADRERSHGLGRVRLPHEAVPAERALRDGGLARRSGCGSVSTALRRSELSGLVLSEDDERRRSRASMAPSPRGRPADRSTGTPPRYSSESSCASASVLRPLSSTTEVDDRVDDRLVGRVAWRPPPRDSSPTSTSISWKVRRVARPRRPVQDLDEDPFWLGTIDACGDRLGVGDPARCGAWWSRRAGPRPRRRRSRSRARRHLRSRARARSRAARYPDSRRASYRPRPAVPADRPARSSPALRGEPRGLRRSGTVVAPPAHAAGAGPASGRRPRPPGDR